MSEVEKMPLQLRYPRVYQVLVDILSLRGLHAYDVEADVTESEHDNTTLCIRYGRDFSETEEFRTNPADLGSVATTVSDFLTAAADRCHDLLKKEYREDMRSSV